MAIAAVLKRGSVPSEEAIRQAAVNGKVGSVRSVLQLVDRWREQAAAEYDDAATRARERAAELAAKQRERAAAAALEANARRVDAEERHRRLLRTALTPTQL